MLKLSIQFTNALMEQGLLGVKVQILWILSSHFMDATFILFLPSSKPPHPCLRPKRMCNYVIYAQLYN